MKLSEIGYSDLSNISTEKIVQMLSRAEKSLKSHIARGNRMGGARSLELLDRFEALRQELQDRDYNLWKEWCDTVGSDAACTGYDYFA